MCCDLNREGGSSVAIHTDENIIVDVDIQLHISQNTIFDDILQFNCICDTSWNTWAVQHEQQFFSLKKNQKKTSYTAYCNI